MEIIHTVSSVRYMKEETFQDLCTSVGLRDVRREGVGVGFQIGNRVVCATSISSSSSNVSSFSPSFNLRTSISTGYQRTKLLSREAKACHSKVT
jgi:hypothetical protein